MRSLADEVPFDIPDSWEWVRLGSAFAIEMGQSPAGNTVSGNCSGTEFHQGKVFFGEKYVKASDQYTSSPTKFAPENSVLLCVRAPVGKVNITDRGLCIGRGLCAIIPLAGMPLLFAYYLLAAYENIFVKQATGTTFVAITAETVKNQLIPMPPLAEQQRIADLIERLIPYVDEYGKAESAVDQLNCHFPEALKKSILQEAVQGKLVPQDPSDEPAEALLERIRAEKQRLIKEGKIKKDKHESVIFRRDNSHYEKLDGMERCIDDELPFEIPESWAWVRWGAIAESIQYGYNAPAKQEGRIRMVRISDIHENTVAWSSVPFCDIDDSDIPTYLLQANDILFARTGGTVGKSFLVSEVPCESIYAGYLIRTRYSSLLCPQYLKYFMESPLYWQQLKSGTTATAQPNCNGQTLAKMLLPLPPANEQLRIVDNLARTFAIIERM